MKKYITSAVVILFYSTALAQNSLELNQTISNEKGNRGEDTCIVIKPGFRQGKDAIVHGLDSERNVNYGLNGQLTACSWTFSGIPGDVRGLIEFDLDLIPPGSEVTSAKLSLFAWGEDYGLGQHAMLSGSNAAWLRRITSSWEELEVTWITQPSTTTVNQVFVNETDVPNLDYLDIDVTNLVVDMLASPDESFGFMLQMQVEEYYRKLNFCTSDHEDSSKHPKLEICYTPPIDLGISIEDQQQEIVIFPNPANSNEIVNIRFDSDLAADFQLDVFNLLGERIQVPWFRYQNELRIAIEDLSKGTYIICLLNGQTKYTRKLVVTH